MTANFEELRDLLEVKPWPAAITALAGWAEALGDFAAIELVPYFEVYRALVRVKVAAIRVQHRPARTGLGLRSVGLRMAEAVAHGRQ